jgi:ribosomal protein S18 acetylase RimI-like enzyme
MTIDIQTYQHASLAAEIGIFCEFQSRFFREFPYLYARTEEYEQEYMAEYIANPTARLVVARNAGKAIGVATGTMLSTAPSIVGATGDSLQKYGIQPQRCFYIGEVIVEPEYRRHGIPKQLLEQLKNAGREQGAQRFCFLAIYREPDDARRPADYIDIDLIFSKVGGFVKIDVSVTFEWPTIQPDGSVENAVNRLDFWIDRHT